MTINGGAAISMFDDPRLFLGIYHDLTIEKGEKNGNCPMVKKWATLKKVTGVT